MLEKFANRAVGDGHHSGSSGLRVSGSWAKGNGPCPRTKQETDMNTEMRELTNLELEAAAGGTAEHDAAQLAVIKFIYQLQAIVEACHSEICQHTRCFR